MVLYKTNYIGTIHYKKKVVALKNAGRPLALLYERLYSTLFARSFRRRFFSYHQAVKHPHTSIILSCLSIPSVLKCAAKFLTIGKQIKC